MQKNQIRTKCLKHLTLLITYHITELLMLTHPGHVRVVFDVSVKYHGTSLNKYLLPGLDLLSNLISVLRRFRQGKFAVMADIKQMYRKVPLVETDALRFLWRDNPAEGLSEYVMLIQVFGKVDSPFNSNWALRQVPLKTGIF